MATHRVFQWEINKSSNLSHQLRLWCQGWTCLGGIWIVHWMGVTGHLHIFLLLYPFPSPAPSQRWCWVGTAALAPPCMPSAFLAVPWEKLSFPGLCWEWGIFSSWCRGQVWQRSPWIPGNCLFPLQLLPSTCRHKHQHHLLIQQLPSLTSCRFPLAGAVFPLSALESPLFSPCRWRSCLPSHSPLTC